MRQKGEYETGGEGQTEIRPAMLYGSAMATTKRQERRKQLNEMRMPRDTQR